MIKKIGFMFLAAAMVMAITGCNKEKTVVVEKPVTAKPAEAAIVEAAPAEAAPAEAKPLDHPAH